MADTWFHVAMVFDDKADMLTEYINGTQGRVWRGVPRGLAASTTEFRIGTNLPSHSGRVFRGLLDDLRLYSNPLSLEDLLEVIKGSGPAIGRATGPRPQDKAIDIPRYVVLSWTAGVYPCTHDVYFGQDMAAVGAASRTKPNGLLVARDLTATSYDPTGLLEFGKTYYWRVDEVNTSPDKTIHKGQVWSFTVEPYSYAVKPLVEGA